MAFGSCKSKGRQGNKAEDSRGSTRDTAAMNNGEAVYLRAI